MTMRLNLGKLMALLLVLYVPVIVFGQCTHCSVPTAPSSMTYSGSSTYYQGALIQLWIAPPSVAVDGYEWYKVSGTDTTFVGNSDTMSYVADTSCRFIARSINNCVCVGSSTVTKYYSSYAAMGTITVVNVANYPTCNIVNYTPVICSGTPSDIIISSSQTYYNNSWTRNNTSNVSGTSSSTPYNGGGLPVTLTNNTSVVQAVRFLIHFGSTYNSGFVNGDCKSFYVTVLPSSAPTANNCYIPPVPHSLFNQYGAYAMTFYKGSHIQLLADSTITADSLFWYRVNGTDTSYVGKGYSISVTADTTSSYIARNANYCNCSSQSVYYGALFPMYNLTVATGYTPGDLIINNNMPAIASGTQTNLVSQSDNDTMGYFNGFTMYRDNAYVSGSKNANGNIVLTNTTSAPQLVRYICLSAGYPKNTNYGSTSSGYITVLPSTSTAPTGNHCSQPAQTNPSSPGGTANAYGNVAYFVKGATINLDLGNKFGLSMVNTDSIVWYKSRWTGDTTYLGGSFPTNAVMDTNCTIFTVSKNVCYWSDSTKHIYYGPRSMVGQVKVTAITDPQVSFANNAPYICNGQPTNISVSGPSGSIVTWDYGNSWLSGAMPKVKGIKSGNFYYNFPAALRDTLTDTVSTPQKVNFEAYSYTTVSGKNYYGSSALTSVVVYPSCSSWASNTITIRPANDSICAGDTATLIADTLPCYGGTRYVWSTGDTTRSIRRTAAGTYTVTATNICGCSATASGIVVIKTSPTSNVNNASVCSGTTATISASGGISYLWSTGATTASISTAVAGIYIVTVTNSSGCRSSVSDTITALVFPTPNIIINHKRDNSNGSINVSLSGGYPPYSFLWGDIPILSGIDSINTIDSVFGFNVYKLLPTLNYRCGIDSGYYHVVMSDSLCGRGDTLIHIGRESNWIFANGITPSNDNSRDSSGGISNLGLLSRIDTLPIWNTGIFVANNILGSGQKGELEITGITPTDSFAQYAGITALDSSFMVGLTDPGNPTTTYSTVSKYLFYFKDNKYYTIDQDGMSNVLGDCKKHYKYRVCSNGTQVNYWVDGNIIKTVSISQPTVLYGTGGILTSGGLFKARFITY